MNQLPDKKQKGQVIIILLLLVLVALSIGLALTQRSVTDVTTSTQAEQASRAFSAAEAGIQKALTDPNPVPGLLIPLNNNSSALVDSSALLPFANTRGAIEYPKIGRETTAQFWFVDPSSAAQPPNAFYNSSNVALFYGNEFTTDLPAVEVKIVMLSGGNFYTYSKYYDSSAARSSPPNGNRFNYTLGCSSVDPASGTLGNNRRFFCRQVIGPIPNLGGSGDCTTANGCTLILARVRFLYINENHSLAMEPLNGANFPPQVQIYNALGTSGQSQKQIQAFRVKDVVLPWFDFAIFSTNEIRK